MSAKEEGPGLSTLAQRLAEKPELEAQLREALNEFDEEQAEGEGGDQS